MQSTKKNLSDTKISLTLVADAELISDVKQHVLQDLAKDLKLQGFRPGKAPLHIVEKNVAQATLQTEFLDHIMNRMYGAALEEHKLRPVSQPEVKINKFVPFETVEIEAEVEVVGDIKLTDYKKIKLAKKPVKIVAKDVDEVIAKIVQREATKKPVERAVKDGDETIIDFDGVDAKTKEPIAGADGKDYTLGVGSNTFIPGFEENLIGMKINETKTFTVTFPADYGAKALQKKKVEFTVTIKSINELVEPKLDDEFATKVGPFKTVAELKADVKKQLESEQQTQIDRQYADDLIIDITNKSTVAIPTSLIDEQVGRLEQDQRQNLMYRGQTWQEFLESVGNTEEEYRTALRPDAELRVKAGLILSEIAEAEKVTITPEELEVQMQLLKGRYPDAQMQGELEKPEARREIASRILSEKTIAKLVGYATAK